MDAMGSENDPIQNSAPGAANTGNGGGNGMSSAGWGVVVQVVRTLSSSAILKVSCLPQAGQSRNRAGMFTIPSPVQARSGLFRLVAGFWRSSSLQNELS
jgi:hypothetical protein